MIYTSQKVFKLDTKKSQFWMRWFAIDGTCYEYIVYPNGKVYYYSNWKQKWMISDHNRLELEKYGEFICYL